MRARLTVVLALLACEKVSVDISGRDCDGQRCVEGWVCHPELERCVRPVRAACDGTGVCPSSLTEGTPCASEGSFVPCADGATGCDDGCRTCDGGVWSVCTGCVQSNGGLERCDGRDNDCNAVVDDLNAEGCTDLHQDVDGDGFGAVDAVLCLCSPSGYYRAAVGGDCDDDPAACGASCNPQRAEVCNGRDDDCDGATDEEQAVGCQPYYRDRDGDQLGASDEVRCLCAAEPGWVSASGDCDPDVASCTTDCVTNVDADPIPDCRDSCIDVDQDGRGAGGGCPSDCDDGNVNAWSTCQTCRDADGDGYRGLCDQDTDNSGGDCADDPVSGCGASCSPGRAERCDGQDNDCNGSPDDGALEPQLCPNQRGVCAGAVARVCNGGAGWAGCVDADYDAWVASQGRLRTAPGPSEPCDGQDNDCDGVIDEGCHAPSNFTAGINPCNESDLTIDTTQTVSSDAPSSLGVASQGFSQSGAPNIGVIYVNNLRITASGRLNVTGVAALAVVACGDIWIDGTLDVSARDGVGGPGGYDGLTGPAAGGNGNTASNGREAGGGGGGGNCGAGGGGGIAGSESGGAAGGTSGNAEQRPLRGGSGGGLGGGASQPARRAGGGGGALQLFAQQRIVIVGTIRAAGAGGGDPASTGGAAGGGAGAGGALLLEGGQVEILAGAVVAANGGGGAGGVTGTTVVDVSGSDGLAGAARAPGGRGAGPGDAGNGGDGSGPLGVRGQAGGSSGAGSNTVTSVAGGGGGGAGWIRINTHRVAPVRDGTLSPAPTSGCMSTGSVSGTGG